MRKYTVIAAAALVFAILPLGAVAAPGDKAPAKGDAKAAPAGDKKAAAPAAEKKK